MGMTGVVHAINQRRGMVALRTESHGFTTIELLGGDVAVGDVVTWPNDTMLGSETYRNVTQGTNLDVIVQNHWVPASMLRQQLLIDRQPEDTCGRALLSRVGLPWASS